LEAVLVAIVGIICTLSRFGGVWLTDLWYEPRSQKVIPVSGVMQAIALITVAIVAKYGLPRTGVKISSRIAAAVVILGGVAMGDVAFGTWLIYREIGGVSIPDGVTVAPLLWLDEGLIGAFRGCAIIAAICSCFDSVRSTPSDSSNKNDMKNNK
jgi:hypothetical protein